MRFHASIICLIFACGFQKAIGQQLQPDMNRLKKMLDPDKRMPVAKYLNPANPPKLISPYYAPVPKEAENENQLGMVYTLPIDNMPMLKPKQQGNIPTLKIENPYTYMPNPFLEKKGEL